MRSILTIALLVSLIGSANAQEKLKLSLDECISYALENNEDLDRAKLENQIAETQIKETLATGLPQVNGSLSVTKNFEVQVTPIPDFISPNIYNVLINENILNESDRPAGFGDIPAAFGTAWNGNAGISARQLIFDGSFFVGLEAAKAVKKLSQRQQKQAEVTVVENVSKAYYLVLISTENLEFIGRNFSTIDTLLTETTAMYENGFSEKIDVSRLKIQHNNLKTDLKNNLDLLMTSLNLLKFQMGMPVQQPLELADKLEDVIVTDLTISQEAPYTARPEYDVLVANRDLIDLNIKNYKSRYLPNLYANFNFGWTSGTNTFNDMTNINDQTWFNYSALGATLSIPIFDGFSKSANIQRNKVQREQLQLSITQFENNVNRQVEEAKIQKENARRNIQTQEENVELAKEVYDITRIKYQEGVGSNLEVVDANTSLKEAQTNYLNALYEGITAQIDLKKATGTLIRKN